MPVIFFPRPKVGYFSNSEDPPRALNIYIKEEPTKTSTQDSKNIGKTSDKQKANPNSLNMSLTKDMK